MSYSMCRFWAYDESKNLLGAGKDAPPWKLVAAGTMGSCFLNSSSFLKSLDIGYMQLVVLLDLLGILGVCLYLLSLV